MAVVTVATVSRGRIERAVFYFPSRVVQDPAVGIEAVTFRSGDGLTLAGWWMYPIDWTLGDAPPPVIVHAHGNAGSVADHADFSRFLTRAGFAVLVFDYRGYGKSDGSRRDLIRDRLVDDTLAAVVFARQRSGDAPVGLMGQSLGGSFAAAAAAVLADRGEPLPAVMLVSAFSSWKGVAGDHAGWLGRLLVRSGVDARDQVIRLGGTPLLIVHGEADAIVPVHHADVLTRHAHAAGIRVETILLGGAEHNDPPEMHPQFTATAIAFFRTHLTPG